MTTLLDYILDLFRNPFAAAEYVADPAGALRDAGLPPVSAAQFASVAAAAAPAGAFYGGGDPYVGLQRAVADHHGIASPFSPSTTFAPQTQTDFASRNNTDLFSGNSTPIASPNQDAGANAQNGAFNLGFGDITLGDKTTNTATNGGVVVDGNNHGDIVSGDGAVLGNNNDVNNGHVVAGTGSNVTVGRGGIEDSGTTATGNATVIQDNKGPVLNDVDASGGHGGGASAGGGGGLIGIANGGNDATGGHGGGGGIVIVDKSTSSNEVGGNQTTAGGSLGGHNSTDASTHTSNHTQANTTVEDHSSSYESNIGSHNDTAFGSGNETTTHTDTHTDVASHNHTALDAF
jgi:hypothetical protein